MHKTLGFFTLLLTITLVGCGSGERTIKPYKMDIQQGNVVTSEMLLKLRPGMTKSQVQFIMGTPLLVDSFHTNRWDYFYQLSKQGKIVNQRRVILDFDGDALARVRGDVVPQGTDIDALMQQAGAENKADDQVSTPAAIADKADLIATPIETPEIESAAVKSEPMESKPVEVAPVEATAVPEMPIVSEPPMTAQKIVKPEPTVEAPVKKEVAPVIEEAEVSAPPVFEMKPAPVEAAPIVAVPKAEAVQLQEPVVTETAAVQSTEEMLEPVKAPTESTVSAEEVQAIAPPVVKADSKVVKPTRAKIPPPPVVESWSKSSAKPTQTKIAAPPSMGSSAKSGSIQAVPVRQKAVDGALRNEEDPGFFERTLEMIGF